MAMRGQKAISLLISLFDFFVDISQNRVIFLFHRVVF